MQGIPPSSRDAKTVAVVRPPGSATAIPSPSPGPTWSDTLDDTTDEGSPYSPGAIIAGRYRLVRQIGRGGMGEVWCAQHLALHTEVAVKFLATSAGSSTVRVALARFRFEAQVSAHLAQRTSHVVAVHDAGRDASGPYLVMEHVRGGTLRAKIRASGALPPRTVAVLVDQVAEALAEAHACGVVHRDLKPSNLLLADQPDGSLLVKLADFGIAKALQARPGMEAPEATTAGWMLGSPAYMSPEQLDGEPVEPRSDLWALGVIAYEALTGRLPFRGRTVPDLVMSRASGRFDAPTTLCPDLPREIDAWFRRAIAKRPVDRFTTADEMARSFRAALAGRPASRTPRLARRAALGVSLCAGLVSLRPAPSPPPAPSAAVMEGATCASKRPGPGLESAPEVTRVPFHR